MDSRHRGEVAQLKILLRATEKGFFCSRPTMEGCRYDLIVDDGNQLYRVQCKNANRLSTHSTNCVSLVLLKRSGGGNGKIDRLYHRNEIDAIIAYLPCIDKVLWLPPEIWEGKPQMSIRTAPAKNNQTKGVILAEDYIW